MWDRSSPLTGRVPINDNKNAWSARHRARARSDVGFNSSPIVVADVKSKPDVGDEDSEKGDEGQKDNMKMSTSRSCEALKYAVSVLTRLDDFICETLGTGFFSNVYKVTHRVTNQVMVLKMNTSLSNRPNMLREVQLMNRLAHPNILKFMGVCVHEGQLHALTEFINDGSLEQLLANSELELPWVTRIGISLDMARGMEYLHSRGVIHRDLTSKNIFIRKESGPENTTRYTAVVGDFGLAAKIPDPLDNSRLSIVGSPYWMAPEVLKDQPYNELADVFSYGIILCEITARINADPDILPRTENFGVDYVAFSEMIEYCPLDFLQLVFKCCQVKPGNRPTFEELVVAVEKMHDKLTNSLCVSGDNGSSNYIKAKKHKRSRSADNIVEADESLHHSGGVGGYDDEFPPITPRYIGQAMSETDPFYSPTKTNPFASISKYQDGRKQLGTPRDPNCLTYDLPSPSYPFTPPCTPITPDSLVGSTHSSGRTRVSRSLPSSPVLLRKAAERLHIESLRGSSVHKLATPASGYRLTPAVLKSKSDIFINGPIQRLCFDNFDDDKLLSDALPHSLSTSLPNHRVLSTNANNNNNNNNNNKAYATSTYISPKSAANEPRFGNADVSFTPSLAKITDEKPYEINDNTTHVCATCSSCSSDSFTSVDDPMSSSSNV